MTSDETFTVLLDRAAGADPGPGDATDVRRRARRHVRRRHATVGVAAAALVLPGLVAAGRLRPDDTTTVVASDTGMRTPPDLVPLFDRPLPDGATLRVSATGNPDEIAVEWPGSPTPVVIELVSGGVTGTKAGDWDVIALQPCPGDQDAHLRVVPKADPSQSDGMELVDGLAVAVVPAVDGPSPAVDELTVETRDAAGDLVSRVGISVTYDDGPADGSSTSPLDLPGGTADDAGDAVDAEPARCDVRP